MVLDIWAPDLRLNPPVTPPYLLIGGNTWRREDTQALTTPQPDGPTSLTQLSRRRGKLHNSSLTTNFPNTTFST